MNLIVDASVAIKWFVAEPYADYADRLQEQPDLYAPDFMLLECSHTLVKKVRRDELLQSEADAIQVALLDAPIHFSAWQDLMLEATQISHQTFRSLYDCLYLVLARRLDGRMVTADSKHYRALKDYPEWKHHLLWIEDL